jgi:hypothetical protein
MFKFIRRLLYGLATISGVAGLLIGGTPLVQFARERLNADGGARDYYDTTYLHAPEIIFLLSLILLVGVCIGCALENSFSLSGSTKCNPGEKPAEPVRAETKKVSPIAEPVILPDETADEKLKRLLDREKN